MQREIWLKHYCQIVFLILCSVSVNLPARPLFAQTPAPAPVVSPRLPFYPLDVAINQSGSVYIADRNLPGVWQYSDSTLTKLIQGSVRFREPLNASRCVAVGPKGEVYVGDTSTCRIYEIDPSGKATVVIDKRVGTPTDLAVAADGTIYVADLELRSLFRISRDHQSLDVVAQVNPRGVFVDSQNTVWVVSQNAEQLLTVGQDGSVTKIIDHRVFEFPHQVVVDQAGVAYVTDGYRKAIWKVVTGKEPAIFFEGAPLDNPVGIAIHENRLIVVDPRAQRVFRFNEAGQPEEWFSISGE
ncbi:MAG: NHL repeat-containing protein [Planctomycetales bacterium]|nr:NHL repeat-containing protein [Planctomycetales bacterium]